MKESENEKEDAAKQFGMVDESGSFKGRGRASTHSSFEELSLFLPELTSSPTSSLDSEQWPRSCPSSCSSPSSSQLVSSNDESDSDAQEHGGSGAKDVWKSNNFPSLAARSPTCAEDNLRRVFFSPHPDDICYSCFGLATERVPTTEGRLLVTVFSRSGCANGSLGARLCGDVDLISEQRRQEDQRFAHLAKCSLLSLVHGDSSLRHESSRRPELETLSSQAQQALIKQHPCFAAVRSSLVPIVMRAVHCGATIFLPLGVGWHIDHWLARVAVVSILDDLVQNTPGCLDEHVVIFYEDLPYAFYSSETTIEQLISKALPTHAEHRLFPLSDALWRRKKAAVLTYRSQKKSTTLSTIQGRAIQLGMRASASVATNEAAMVERVWFVKGWYGS